MSGDDWEQFRPVDADARRQLDTFLSLLANSRRRDLLYHLATTEVTDVDTLTGNVAAAHEEVPVDEVSADVRERVEMDLVHTHLPKLADAGAIEFDRRTEMIRCRDFPTMLSRLLETCIDVEIQE